MKGIALVLVVAATAAFTSSSAQSAGCSRAKANAAIRHVKPHIPGLGDSPVPVTAQNADKLICADFTRDGLTDVALTVASGGTAGDIGWVVLVRTGSGWRLGLARGGYKVGLSDGHGDLLSSQPVYKKNDPNCCPTGGFDYQRWRWNGTRFRMVGSWHAVGYRH